MLVLVAWGVPGFAGRAAAPPAAGGDRVRIGTWNVENYILAATGTRTAKSEASKAKVAGVLKELNADILALQELGGMAAVEDIRGRTAKLGLEYPHVEFVTGYDTNIQVAILSRLPIVARRPHTTDTYLLGGRRFRVSRGIVEVDIRVRPDYALTVFTTHLKSRRTVVEADEAEMRREEARILREKIDRRLREEPRANVIVLGDFNDTKDTEAIRTLIGRGTGQLVDTRPSERNGDTGYTPNPRWQPRTVSWTHYYGVEDSYSRIDYALLNAGAAREWEEAESRVLTVPDWGLASDHRPLLVVLGTRDR
jgi:endonuclease/exonuclease/phosphatase family metal-dependent hydrolase